MEAQRAGVFLWFSTAFDMQNTRVWVKIEGFGFSCPWGIIWMVCILTVEMCIGCNCSAVGKLISFLYDTYHGLVRQKQLSSNGKVGQKLWSYHTGAPCWPSLWMGQIKQGGKKMTKKDVMHFVHSKTKPSTNPELTWYGDWLRTGSATERSDYQWHSPLRNSVQTGNTRAYQNGFTAVALSWCSYWSRDIAAESSLCFHGFSPLTF